MKLSLILFLTLCTSYGFTQDNKLDTLSAKNAVFIALEKNYAVQISKAQSAINVKNNTWSEAGLYPTIALNVGVNTNIQDNSNNPFTFTPGVILSTSLSPNLSLNMNLFSGMAVRISKNRLDQLEQQSNGNALLVIESTILDVLKSYYSAVVQRDRLLVLEVLKKNALDRFKYYDRKQDIGTGSSLEELQFKNLYYSDSINALVQKTSYENSLRNLYLLMNATLTIESLPYLSDSLSINFPLINYQEALAELPNSNQELKNQYIALELQRTNTAFQKSFLYPTLSLQGGFTPSKSWFRDLNDPSLQINTEVLLYNAGLNLRYNLFNNWKNKRAVETSKIQESISQMTYDRIRKSIETTLSSLINSYKGSAQIVDISSRNLNYAKKAWELAETRFNLGTLNSVDLVNFKNSYQNQTLQHFEFIYTKISTYLELYKLSGKLRLDYINP
ncbi:MAG: TolC family protein [Crocinitomicaceae bacterium]|jgi:outer membrane protein TolC|tara:strand:+ start:21230 stop:22567 length:1338 start_codon:yes stop_codon:yes gene_type:complete